MLISDAKREARFANVSGFQLLAREVRERCMEAIGELDTLLLGTDACEATLMSTKISVLRLVGVTQLLEMLERGSEGAYRTERLDLYELVDGAIADARDCGVPRLNPMVTMAPDCPHTVLCSRVVATEALSVLALEVRSRWPGAAVGIEVTVEPDPTVGDRRLAIMVHPNGMGLENADGRRRRPVHVIGAAELPTALWALLQLLERNGHGLFEVTAPGVAARGFLVTLRVAEPPSDGRDLGPEAKSELPQGSQTPLFLGNVLVVDDTPINLMVLERTLVGLGYRVTTATNGQEAVDLFRDRTFDFVLMDCYMPVLDGYEATLLMRTLERGRRRTPIIAVTSAAFEADRERAASVGMDCLIPKPARKADIARALLKFAAAESRESTL